MKAYTNKQKVDIFGKIAFHWWQVYTKAINRQKQQPAATATCD